MKSKTKGGKVKVIGNENVKKFVFFVFALIFVKTGSIYNKQIPSSSAHCTHIVKYILPAKTDNFSILFCFLNRLLLIADNSSNTKRHFYTPSLTYRHSVYPVA